MSDTADYRLIRKSTMCGEITEDEAKILASIMEVRLLKDGELLVSEGDADQSLYILAHGKLAVFSANAEGRGEAGLHHDRGRMRRHPRFCRQDAAQGNLACNRSGHGLFDCPGRF